VARSEAERPSDRRERQQLIVERSRYAANITHFVASHNNLLTYLIRGMTTKEINHEQGTAKKV